MLNLRPLLLSLRLLSPLLRFLLWMLNLRLSLRLLNLRSLLLSLRLLSPPLRLLPWLLNLRLSEPQASVDIAVAFVVLVPVSVVVVEVDSSGRPRFLAFPNVDHFASSSSSVEVVGKESVHSSHRCPYQLWSL